MSNSIKQQKEQKEQKENEQTTPTKSFLTRITEENFSVNNTPTTNSSPSSTSSPNANGKLNTARRSSLMWIFGGSKDNNSNNNNDNSITTLPRRGSDPGLIKRALEGHNISEDTKETNQEREFSTTSNTSIPIVSHSKSLPTIPN
mmetsp:Transcript_5137/g.5260  ORF Transcript_5137/g.5260 Transcript_5137/m.5260 type:complete len:145 (+) Transcript_5137:3433-3867(+)